MEPHRRAELRSLAYHRQIAARLATQPHLLVRARQRVEGWLAAGPAAPAEAEAWAALLTADATAIAVLLTEDSEHARGLRQSSPFAGALTAAERWRLWRETRVPVEAER
jgi:hypothetical protein